MLTDGLIGELSRRRVFRVMATYAVVAWVAVQVASALAPVMNMPDWAVGFIVYLFVLCFPIAMVLAWAFDVGPAGIVTTPGTGSGRMRPRQVLVLATLALLSTTLLFGVLSYTIGGSVVQADATPWRTGELRDRTLGVLPLIDNSPGQDQAWLAKSLGQEILVALPGAAGLQVAEGADAHNVGAGGDIRAVGKALGVTSVLSGNIQRVGSRVRINVRITDTVSGYQVWSASYEGVVEDVFQFQADTASRIITDITGLYASVPVRR